MPTDLDKYSFRFAEDAFLLSTQTFTNGNMLNATAQLLFLCENLPMNLSLLYIKGIHMCRAINGSYARDPNNFSDTSVDDYLALATDEGLAIDILRAARARNGFLSINTINAPWAQFIFRFQGFWQHARISANESVGFLGQFIWAISIIISARQPFTNQDSWSQSHLMVLVKERRGFKSWLMDLAIKYWRKKKGSKTTSEIMAEFTGISDHPLVQAWLPYK